MNNNTGRLPSFPESVMLTGPVKSNTKPNTLNHVPPINPIRSDHVGKPQEGSMMLPSLNEVMKPIFTDNVNMYKQMPSISSFQKQNPSGTHSPTSSPTLPPPNRSGPPSLPGGMPSGMSMGNLPLPSLMNSLPKHQSPMNPHQNTNSPPMGSHQSHQHQGNPPSMNSQHHSHQNNGPQMSPHQSHQHQGNSMGTHQHQNNSSMNSHQHQGNAPIGSQHSHQQNNQSMGNMGHPNNNPSSPMSGHPHNSHNPLLALTHPHTNSMALQNKSNNSNGNNINNNNNINNTNIPINSQPKKQNLYIMNDRNQIEFDRSGVAAPPPLSYGPPGMPMSTQLPYPNNMPMMPNKPNPSNPNYQEQLQEAKRISDNMKANVRGYLDSNATTKKRKTGSDAPETPQPTILSDSRTSAFSPMKKRETHPTVSNNASSEDLSPQEPDRGKLADEQTNFAHLLQNNFSGVNLSNDSCGELLEIYRNFHKNENAKLIPPVPARADLKVENK